MRNLKVIGLLAVMLAVVLAFSGTAKASSDNEGYTVYTVVMGDTFWEMTAKSAQGKGYLYPIVMADNDWTRDPRTLQIGEKIKIRKFNKNVTYIVNHNASPYGAKGVKGDKKVLKAINDTPYSENVKKALEEAVSNIGPSSYILMRGERFDCMTDGKGIHCDSPNGYELAGKEVVYPSVIWTVELDGIRCDIVVKEDCGNVYPRCEEITVIPLPSPKELVQGMDSKTELEQEKIVPREFDPEAMLEAFAGAGYYDNIHSAIDADGYFTWVEGRLYFKKFSFKNFNLKLGTMLKAGLGGGHSGDYRYHSKWITYPGLSVKPYGDHWDATIGATVGKVWKYGGKGSYRSEQTENMFLLGADFSVYKRRLEGELLFPKTTFDLQWYLPYNVNHAHWWKNNELDPNPYDSQRLESGITPFVYDFWSDDHLTRVTPGFRLGGGYEWGPDKSFLRFGPVIQLATYKHSIANFRFDLKEQLSGTGDSQNASISINLVGVADWFRIHGIREAYEDELSIPINIHN